jgi:hypothetical protein
MWKWLIATLLILSSCVQIPFDYGKPEMTPYELAKDKTECAKISRIMADVRECMIQRGYQPIYLP